MRTFLLVCLAQVVSLFGTRLTGFGLGVWAYQRTGSTTVYGLTALATVAPTLLAAPISGALVDRWSPRAAMLAGHAGAGLCVLILAVLAVLAALDALTVEIAWALIALASASSAVQLPGLSTATTLLVPPEQIGRANGVAQIGVALSSVLAPTLGGLLLSAEGLWIVLAVDVLTFTFAMAVLLAVRVPRARAGQGEGAPRRRLLGESLEGFRYIRARPGLVGLVSVVAVANLNLGMTQVLVPPLLLGMSDARTLGQVLSWGGAGMLAGGALLMAWGGPRRLVRGVLGFVALQGVALLIGGARPSVLLIAAGAFGILFTVPLVSGCSQTVWQRKVPPAIQGSVFAARMVVTQFTSPLGNLMAGPLADHVFEPLMGERGALAGSAGALLGVGPGRGVALLLVVLGLQTLAAAALGVLFPRLRRLEEELPDHAVELVCSSAKVGADGPPSRRSGPKER